MSIIAIQNNKKVLSITTETKQKKYNHFRQSSFSAREI